jgi:SOS-response transcriptional repressor LexA
MPLRAPLTDRQNCILDLIVKHFEMHHEPPTIRHLMRQTGITSTNGVRQHLKALESKGFIVRVPFRVRGIILRPDLRRDVKILRFIKNICEDDTINPINKISRISRICNKELKEKEEESS